MNTKFRNHIIYALSIVFFALTFTGCNSKSVKTQNADNKQIDSQNKQYVIVGTFTSKTESKGIYVYEFSVDSGTLSLVSEIGEIDDPSYLTVHSNKKWIYAVSETKNPNGHVAAYRFDSLSGQLTLLNMVSTVGASPCNIRIDKSGKFVLVANYTSGSVNVFPINADGTLDSCSFVDQHEGSGPYESRQESPHAHTVVMGNAPLVYSTDLGSDQIVISKLDTSTGVLKSTKLSVKTTPGSGPRHIEFNKNKTRLYVSCELNGTVEAYNIDPESGGLKRFQIISTLPDTTSGYPATADIHLTPSEKFLYVSNRSNKNNIAIFKVDASNGELKAVGYQSCLGDMPRNFVIDPSGKFLLVANQKSDNVFVFRINETTGTLQQIGKETRIPGPACLKFYNYPD